MTEQRGWWQRLVGWAQGGDDPVEQLAPPEPYPVPVPPPERPEHDAWLATLIEAAAEGKRVDEIGAEEFWQRVRALYGEQREMLSMQWLEKFLVAPVTPERTHTPMRLQLVEWMLDRGTSGDAVAHLHALTSTEHATRAHYWLGEHYRRTGDEVQALRHYEAVLARDMDYPNVRARVERIRAARGRASGPSQGETIAGVDSFGGVGGARYRLVSELGRGATGVVYVARDMELERDVAVKLLHPHLASARQAEACAQFFTEARVAASLRHPNIVAILDIDENARRIVMEHAAGGTLRQILRERGPRTVRRALERHSQILSALAAAHRRGVVHRDLKPANLLFRRDPDSPGAEIVLADFGIANLPNLEEAKEADPSKIKPALGTLAYMAPEHRRGESTAKSDVYASAVVLFEMLTGKPPWTRDVLLAGNRTRDDFALPKTLTAAWPERLALRVQDHMLRLGDPEQDRRLDTEAALAEARALRDTAIAG